MKKRNGRRYVKIAIHNIVKPDGESGANHSLRPLIFKVGKGKSLGFILVRFYIKSQYFDIYIFFIRNLINMLLFFYLLQFT